MMQTSYYVEFDVRLYCAGVAGDGDGNDDCICIAQGLTSEESAVNYVECITFENNVKS